MKNLRAYFFATFFVLPFCLNAANETNSVNSISQQRYKVAVCDWMILKRQKLGAFQLAKDIGADGVEVDMGSLGQRETFANSLTNAAIRQQFLDKEYELNLNISSLAMSGFYAQSFAERTNTLQLVEECVDTMKAMDVKIAFLPLGITSDLFRHPELRPQVVERLKAAGKIAEKADVLIGVESELPAAEQNRLLDEINSPAIRVCFNFADAIQNNRDLVAELRTLGVNRICEIHATDQDGVWLQNDSKVNMPGVKAVLDEMNWRGWLVVERSRDTNEVHNVKKNFSANAAYLKSIFQN